MVGQCCATGSLHTGTPQGTVKKVHGLDCYVAEPSSNTPPKGIVVILPDIFGWTMPNTRLLADRYAERGEWTVYLPEFMDGHAAAPTLLTSLEALDNSGISKLWHLLKVLSFFIPFKFYTRESIMRPRIFDFFHALKRNEAEHLPVGVAGFCWGGYWSTMLSHSSSPSSPHSSSSSTPSSPTPPLITATFTAHPSSLAIPTSITPITIPTSIAAGTLDNLFPPSQVSSASAILAAKTARGEGPHEVILYEGAKHGFANKGSEMDDEERARSERAEEQAVGWFRARFAEC